MSALIPFENAALPAYLQNTKGFSSTDDLTSGVGQGYPTISIKGSKFTLVRGEERTLITRPGEKEPAGSIDVVILRANPALSKVYYSTGFVEGSDSKPDCYSNDGIVPAKDAENPQSTKCATCAHSQWGSKITENDKKGKACADSRRVAVAMPGMLHDPMLIRVPAASLKTLAQYGDMLKKRGVPSYNVVITKIGFDYTVAHPALTFTPVGFVDEATALEAGRMASDLVVEQIIGVSASGHQAFEPAGEQEPAHPAAAPAAEKKPAGKAKAAPLTEALAEAESTPAAKVNVETPAKAEMLTEAVKEAAAPAATAVVVDVEDLDDEISKALANLDFDD